MATASPSPSLLRRLGRGFVDYWRRIGDDYRTVAKETAEACVKKPFKAGFYFTGLGTLVYAYRTNPSELRTMNELRESRQRMTMLPASIHNKETDAELAERSLLISQHRLHYYNLWFFSLLVQSPHDRTIARVFTSVQDTGDSLLIVSFAIAAVLNAVLFAQFFLYWSEVKRKKMR
ncbi:hypothetical protein TELCIR_06906 [Teladorsagia circumcincta]|uniref:Uncharacterized protein n=1 Tax=Teladorsagia circumcincta TaxID=45464 RepID=A0A2G9UNA2_TELCI|nr:hypothetical protein TELCIR_06906 [Teladorsagia circumcincta]